MKKRTQIILFLLVMSLFVLALSVSASAACSHAGREVTSVEYSDYTQKGKIIFTCPSCSASSEEVAPLLKIKGYSVSDSDDGLCTSYDINNKVLSEIAKLNPSFDLGLVAGSKSLLGDKMPLDGKTGAPTDLSQYGASVIKASALSSDYSEINMKICGFDSVASFEQLYLSAYVYDGSNVKYVQSSTVDKPQRVTLVAVKNKSSVVIDNVTFSLFDPISTIAWDRQKQMNNSKADYNTGTSHTESQINQTKSDTDLITNFFTSLAYPNASSYMKHYLSGKGTDYTINMSSSGFFKSSYTKEHRVTRITQAMRAAEALAVEGGSVDIYQQGEIVNAFPNTTEGKLDDWYLSVGSYFTCINMLDVTVNVAQNGTKTYSATVEYNVADFYNWDPNDPYRQFKELLPSPQDLHELHKAGIAQEFVSSGVVKYSITWTEGQSADQITLKEVK